MSSQNTGSTWEPRDEAASAADVTALTTRVTTAEGNITTLQGNTAALTEASGNVTLAVAANKSIAIDVGTGSETLTVDSATFGTAPAIVHSAQCVAFSVSSTLGYGFVAYNTAAGGANLIGAATSGSSNQFPASSHLFMDEAFGQQMQLTKTNIQFSKPITGDSAGAGIPVTLQNSAITVLNTNDITLSAAQIACPQHRLSGSISGSFNVIGPAIDGEIHFVHNNTNHIVTYKASGQVGVTVAAGKNAIIVGNGTDYEIMGTGI